MIPFVEQGEYFTQAHALKSPVDEEDEVINSEEELELESGAGVGFCCGEGVTKPTCGMSTLIVFPPASIA